eukprot:m.129875 g.129875  ORF g.129875 m.129875 type:complete len:482 (-) comp9464_c0_seq7:2134-3579(-)
MSFKTQTQLDEEKVIEFFNDLELKDDHSDLYLLLEAEKRRLLNPVCDQILVEARRRGWMKPLEGSEGRLEVYQVKYLGATYIKNVNSGDNIVTSHVSEALSIISKNPRAAFQSHLLMEVHAAYLRVFDVERDNMEGSSTMRRLKNLTLRKILGKKTSGSEKDLTDKKTDNCEMIMEHDRDKIVNFLSFDRIVAIVVKETDFTDKVVFNCHAYKLSHQNKAFEVADHLRVTHEGILKRKEVMRKKQYPIERVTLSCSKNNGSYGINLIGPSTRVEASTGVFILKIDKGSVASKHPVLKEGLQILAVNGINTEEVTVSECREQIRASKSSVVLDLQENPFGFGLHQYQQGVRKPFVNYHLEIPSMNESRVDGVTLQGLHNTSSVKVDSPSKMNSLSSSIAGDHVSSNDHKGYHLENIHVESESEDEEDEEEDTGDARHANKHQMTKQEKRLSSQVDEAARGLFDLSLDNSFTSQRVTIETTSW